MHRRETVCSALLFIFRATDIDDWKTLNLKNVDDKIKLLDKLKHSDF